MTVTGEVTEYYPDQSDTPSALPIAELEHTTITVVSTGNGDAAGLNKITGDLTKMAAQVPALFETLSGVSLSELFGKVRTIGDKAPKTNDQAKGATQ